MSGSNDQMRAQFQLKQPIEPKALLTQLVGGTCWRKLDATFEPYTPGHTVETTEVTDEASEHEVRIPVRTTNRIMRPLNGHTVEVTESREVLGPDAIGWRMEVRSPWLPAPLNRLRSGGLIELHGDEIDVSVEMPATVRALVKIGKALPGRQAKEAMDLNRIFEEAFENDFAALGIEVENVTRERERAYEGETSLVDPVQSAIDSYLHQSPDGSSLSD